MDASSTSLMSSDGHMLTVSGLATARGLASGPVFVYRGDGEIPIPQYVVSDGQEQDELMRLKRAVVETKRDLEGLISVLKERTGRADVRVFECHLMILEDEVLLEETTSHVEKDHLNAEAAVRRTMNGARAQFERMNDPYFRERVRDIDDVERRLLKQLTGYGRNTHLELKSPSIVVADDLTPSETVQLPREFVLGFATNGGSSTSHVALLARALGIPAVTGLVDITSRVTPGKTVLLDGTNGTVTIDPDPEAEAQFTEQVRRQREFTVKAMSCERAGALKDGGEVRILANIHPGVPSDGLRNIGARGVGLYRSEYLWLDSEREPTEDEQFVAYREAVEATSRLADDARIVIRMLDIGGDKLMRGISNTEANPFLGNRSIRYLLTHRDVLRTQYRAILRASAFGRAAIMYPMVSCIEEIAEASVELESVKRDLESEGVAFDRSIPVGAMIEVPSAALLADVIADRVDFFSIGTNDLVQYTMAADRGNDSVAHLYQPLNPAIIALVKMTVAAAKRRGISVAVCGESASDPVLGVFWAALGVDSLSMSATYIPAMVKVLSHLTRADLDEYAKVPDSMPRDSRADEIFARCRAWLVAKVPEVEEALA